MKHLILPGALALLTLLCACKKKKTSHEVEEETIPVANTQPGYLDYAMLKKGNYWVYGLFTLNGAGSSEFDRRDSCYVAGDTVIRGFTYSKYVRMTEEVVLERSYLRDSLHYLINSNGEVLFSSEDFTKTLYTTYLIGTTGNNMPDTAFRVDLQMVEKDIPVQVEAGNFVTSNARYQYTPHKKSAAHKTDYAYKKYAKGTGLVHESYPLSLPDYRGEKRLLRYRVN